MQAIRRVLEDAHKLLADDNLVWSQDFELVREFLAEEFWLESRSTTPKIHYIKLAAKLIGKELTHGNT